MSVLHAKMNLRAFQSVLAFVLKYIEVFRVFFYIFDNVNFVFRVA